MSTGRLEAFSDGVMVIIVTVMPSRWRGSFRIAASRRR